MASKSAMDQLLEEDLTKQQEQRIKILEEEFAKAKKRLLLQKQKIDVLARKIKRLEEK